MLEEGDPMVTAAELYHNLCETTSELQPILQQLAGLGENPRIRQTCDAIARLLTFRSSPQSDSRAQLLEYLDQVSSTLIPVHYQLGQLACTEAVHARSAIQKVLDFGSECANELVCV